MLTIFNKHQVLTTNLTSEPAHFYELLCSTKENDADERELVNSWAAHMLTRNIGFAVVLQYVPGRSVGTIRFYVEGEKFLAVHWIKADGKAIYKRPPARA